MTQCDLALVVALCTTGCGLALPADGGDDPAGSAGDAVLGVGIHNQAAIVSGGPTGGDFSPEVASSLASGTSRNNQISVFLDRDAFPALESMVANASSSIFISTFSWHMDEPGLRIADLVARKAARGVTVRVLIDQFGQSQTPGDDQMVDWLQNHGVETLRYPRKVIFPRGLLNFSHRKIYLVDGNQAMIGSANIGHEYAELWHDELARVQGDSVAQMYSDWLRDWTWSGGSKVPLPAVPYVEVGNATTAVIATSPLEPGRTDEVHRVLLAAIDNATSRIWCGYPYWGDSALVSHLVAAARRGVDVRAIVPYQNDTPEFAKLNRFIVRDLSLGGVKVRWWTENFAHIKYMVADGMAEIGSSNADTSSFEYQQELDLLTANAQFTDGFVAKVPAADWEKSRDAVAADWNITWDQRPETNLLYLLDRYL